jgi:hypothetical protein
MSVQKRKFGLLNRTQLVIAWITCLLISCFVLVPAIRSRKFYKYESRDGWYLEDVSFRKDEEKDAYGSYYEQDGKKYYYKGTYPKYSMDTRRHPYERISLIILLNGTLLIYTFKGAKTDGNSGSLAENQSGSE